VTIQLNGFLTSAVDVGGQLHAPAVLSPEKEPSVAISAEGRVSLRDTLDAVK
jgi:hypothetical protein